MTEKKKTELVDLDSLVVNGTKHVQNLDTTIGRFRIRPLSLGEKSTLKFLPWKTMNPKTADDKIDESEIKDSDVLRGLHVTEEKDQQKFQAIAWGLSIKKEVTVEKIRAMIMPKEIVKVLYEKILEISEVTEDDLQPFPSVSKRK
jgi:hypothetical protein